MSTALQIEPDIGLQELLEISNSENWSVQYSPFLTGPGGQIGGTIIRQAAPWKGMSEDKIQELYPDVYDGLQEAQKMVQENKEDGVALVRQNGQMKIMPQTAANLAVAGEQDATILAGPLEGFGEAVQELNQRGGQAHLPTVA